MSARRLGLGVGALAIDKVVITLVQLVSLPLLVHAWGVPLYGVWVLLSTVPLFLVLGDFGIVTSTWSRMTMFIARGEMDRARTALHTGWRATTLICAAILVLFAGVVLLLPDGVLPLTGEFGEFEARATVIMLTAYGLGTIAFRLNTSAISANANFPLSSWVTTAAFAVENLALFGAVLLGGGPEHGAMALLLARGVTLSSLHIVSWVRRPELRSGFAAASRAEWAELWPPAREALVLGVGFLFFLQASVVTLGAVAGAAALPVFVAVRTVSRIGLQASQLISAPVAQEFGRVLATDQLFRGGRYFAVVMVPSAVMALGMAIALIVLGEWAVRVWTAGAIEPSGGLLVAMALSSFAVILWNPLSTLILAVNRQKSIALASLLASGIALAFIALTGNVLRETSAGIAFAFVDGVTLVASVTFACTTWLREAEFRRGIAAALVDLRSPGGVLRSVLSREK